MSTHQERDPFEERLSEYLDGDLDGGERARVEGHLATCARCRATLEDMGRIRAAARALPEREPPSDLWPGIARALAPRDSLRVARPLLAFAAGILATLAGVWLFARLQSEGPTLVANAPRYLLLLHEPQDSPAPASPEENAAVVERYTRWARELGERCLGGDELAPAGHELRPEREPAPLPAREHVGGYFVLQTRDEAEAIALARTCPHLDNGGWVELRPIVEH